MARTLYLTTELPYFPGQGGLMALQLRQIAGQDVVGVVGPRHAHQPEAALDELRRTVSRSYWWPEGPNPGALPALPEIPAERVRWLRRLPPSLRRGLLRALTGLDRHSDEALAWRVALAQLAPKLLEALGDGHWNTVLLSQSTSAAWLPFLPASLARCLYFHDIRSDYLRRAPRRPARGQLRRVLREEQQAARSVETMAVVSELDHQRAEKLLRPAAPTAVAPICVDPDYFAFRPPAPDAPPVLLFTGHLSHPPNVDAALHLLADVWPRVRAAVPDATLVLAGLQPAPEVMAAAAAAPRVELIANAPDIRPYFRRARVYAVPMRYGGGVRQKILEAWASGLPVVSTAMGAEGLGAEDGRHCWLRDDPAAFAAQVVALLRSPAPAAVLEAARALVLERHGPQKSGQKLATQIRIAAWRKRLAPPRVLFDLRWLVPGEVGGVEQMTHELVDELAACDRTFEYRLLGTQRVCHRWKFPAGFRHRLHVTDGRRDAWRSWRDAAANELAAGLDLPVLLPPEVRALDWFARLDFTVVHGLPCLIRPELRRFPAVVTMHDLQHLHLPQFFPPEDIATREHEYRASCAAASHVICTSEFTRQDVHQRYGVPLEKMTTVWNLPPRVTGQPLRPATASRLLQRMGVAPPFLFFPAHPWIHKNHRGLLEAFLLLGRLLPRDYRLVMTGQPLRADHPAAALLADSRLRGRVVHLGYRTPLEIAVLYRSAEALVFPSLFEGFGLPLIEAMQQGCPIVCGHHSSLPEIAGNAALYADVASPDALASAILEITRDAGLRARLKGNGVVNLRRFIRRDLAEKTRAIYAAVHDQHFA